MIELKPLVKVLVGGGVKKLGKERASREKNIFGDTKWIVRGASNQATKFNNIWYKKDNPLRTIAKLHYIYTYELTIEDIKKYIYAADGDLKIIVKDSNKMDGKHRNILQKCIRYMNDLPISVCARYLYNHPELLGGFLYDPNSKTIIKTYKGEEKDLFVSKVKKEKYGKAGRKKLTIEQYANSWSEDICSEDKDKKKGK